MEKRFDYVYRAGDFNVIVDKMTGVQYILVEMLSGGCGLSVLVDKDGKPLLAPGYPR